DASTPRRSGRKASPTSSARPAAGRPSTDAGRAALLQRRLQAAVEAAEVLLVAADQQAVVGAAGEAALDLLADRDVLAVEHRAVEQLEGAPPVRLGLLVTGLLGHEHGVHEQRPVGGFGEHAEVADVVRVIDTIE